MLTNQWLFENEYDPEFKNKWRLFTVLWFVSKYICNKAVVVWLDGSHKEQVNIANGILIDVGKAVLNRKVPDKLLMKARIQYFKKNIMHLNWMQITCLCYLMTRFS